MRNFWPAFIILLLFFAGSAQGLMSQFRLYGAEIIAQPNRYYEGIHYLLFFILIGMIIIKIRHERRVKREREDNVSA